jgi:hypothetical protein
MYRDLMMLILRCVTASLVLFAASGSHAALTHVSTGPGHEPGLMGAEGILDEHFGLENLVRVDDSIDQYWQSGGNFTVKTLAKWAGFRQSFGVIGASGDFNHLLEASNRESLPEASFRIDNPDTTFRFGLDPSGAPLWSSALADNTDAFDHMVTWRITANRNKNLVGAFVTAWEDLANGGDQDYNDLVLLIEGDISIHGADQLSVANAIPSPHAVPVPAALWLFASGLFGLGFLSRRY